METERQECRVFFYSTGLRLLLRIYPLSLTGIRTSSSTLSEAILLLDNWQLVGKLPDSIMISNRQSDRQLQTCKQLAVSAVRQERKDLDVLLHVIASLSSHGDRANR